MGLVLAGLAVGCTGPRAQTEQEAEALTGIADAIIFHAEAGPVDVAGTTTETLTLGDARRRALSTDARIQAALSRVRVAEAEADQARLLPNPILGVFLHFPKNGVAAPFELSVGEDLLSLLQLPGRTSAADNRLRVATAAALTTTLDVLAEVESRYAAVQATAAHLQVLEERTKLVARLLGLARARLAKGEGTQLDVTTLEAQEVDLRTEIAELRLEDRELRLVLARELGEPSGPTDWKLSPWERPPPAFETESGWLAAAAERRPEIQARVWELAALGDDLRVTYFAPFAGGAVGVDVQTDRGTTTGPSFVVPVPIFDFGQARRAATEARIVEARHQFVAVRRQVIEEVRRAFAAFAATRATLEDVAKNLVPLQQKRQHEAEAAYLAGQTDVTPLFLAERDAQTARIRRVELERKTSEAFVRLSRAVGGPGVVAAVAARESK